MSLRLTTQDIGFLALYLHDAVFESTDIRFDPHARILEIDLHRPRYEAPHRNRFALMPVVQYQVVPATLRVRGVRSAEIRWKRGTPEEVGYPNNIESITLDGATLVFHVDSVTIQAELTIEPSIELVDTGPPSEQPRITDYFTSVVRFADLDAQLRRLRSDA